MDNKGFYSYIMLEFKGFLIGLVVGAIITVILYYLSSQGMLPFQMPFGQALQQAATRR